MTSGGAAHQRAGTYGPGRGPTAAAAHRRRSLGSALSAEVGDKGVTVNAVCPGFVDSPLMEVAIQNLEERARRRAKTSSRACVVAVRKTGC